jgi:hypothetical protein
MGNDSKAYVAVDTPRYLLALSIKPAHEQERSQLDALCQQSQQATDQAVKWAWADQVYGRAGQKRCDQAWHRAGSAQAARSEKRFYAPAPALGGQAQLCLAGSLQATQRNFESVPQGLAALHLSSLPCSELLEQVHDTF